MAASRPRMGVAMEAARIGVYGCECSMGTVNPVLMRVHIVALWIISLPALGGGESKRRGRRFLATEGPCWRVTRAID